MTATPLVARALDVGFTQLARRGLRGVWVRGTFPDVPFIWTANHHSWWDAFVARAVLQDIDRPASLLMEADNLATYGFLRQVGVIPTVHVRAALRSVREGSTLIIFPEGELRTAGPLGTLAPGAGWLAAHAPAPLVPIAVRIVLRAQQYPEAYVDVAAPTDSNGLTAALAAALQALDADLIHCAAATPIPGFRRVLRGRRSWDERLVSWLSTLSR